MKFPHTVAKPPLAFRSLAGKTFIFALIRRYINHLFMPRLEQVACGLVTAAVKIKIDTGQGSPPAAVDQHGRHAKLLHRTDVSRLIKRDAGTVGADNHLSLIHI